MSKITSVIVTTLGILPVLGLAQETDSAVDEAVSATEVIVVHGEYRRTPVNQVASSVAVIDRESIASRAATHTEELLNGLANINFAGGSSRARFIQIRGIGERSQFVDPISASVGILFDGIQYSGLGQVMQLFDVSQVEVYRGPQSGRFGADGLAGMIVLESTRAAEQSKGLWHLGIGNYGERQGGLALGGELGRLGRAQLSVYQQRTDGFTENAYLQRDDTQSRSERMVRLNVFTDLSDHWQVRTTLHQFKQDNGYDAFSLDNTRTTLSDEPGEDDLSSRAQRLELSYLGWNTSELQLSGSWLSADSLYSYDEDWSYVGIAPGWEYSSVDAYRRDRNDRTFEIRWQSTQPLALWGYQHDWVVGYHDYRRSVDLQRNFLNFDTYQPDQFNSRYSDERRAIYGEWTTELSSAWRLTQGLRLERYDNDYNDSQQVAAKPQDTMWGGRLSLSYSPEATALWYGTLARGYKIGGVNGEALGKVEGSGLTDLTEFLLARSTFAPELLTSFELGYKWQAPAADLQTTIALFSQWRDDVQLKGWVNRDQAFVGYIQNAASGRNQGLELQLQWQPSQVFEVSAQLGLLDTQIEGFITEEGIDMSGREQAHAPRYQGNIQLDYDLSDGLKLTLQGDFKDRFYYSDSHFGKSDALRQLHARLSWQLAQWQLSLWGRNLTDQQVGTRGFFFGNDPRIEYEDRLYQQWGEPRRVGLSVQYAF